MTKQELLATIKKEYKELRDWRNADPGRSGYMMYDLSDGTVWSDCFLDISTTTTYQSQSIGQFDLWQHDTVADCESYMYDFMISNFNYE